MRIGQNPAKSVESIPQPAEITVAVIIYIPFLGGYYAQSLEVLKLCLGSIWANTQIPYDLMVFDNASCPEVRELLISAQGEGKIQYLTLAEKNMGKVAAWNHIFGAAPGKYLAYADADIYHFPGWLAPQVEVLKRYPQAGMVTGMPLLSPEKYSTATVNWAETSEEVTLKRGRLFPWEDFWRHAGTLGGGEEKARTFFEENEAVQVNYDDGSLFVGAAHFQFVSPVSMLRSIGPLEADRPMGQVRQLDEAVNARGGLRFSTPQWHVQHIGNTIPAEGFLAREGGSHTLDVHASLHRNRSIWDLKPFQAILRRVYSRSFEILYKTKR
jgi:hypothetical protein